MTRSTADVGAKAPTRKYRRAGRTAGDEIPDAVLNFENLPNVAYVRQPVVEALFSCSPSSVWRKVKAGVIPAPKKMSARITCWNVLELKIALARLGE